MAGRDIWITDGRITEVGLYVIKFCSTFRIRPQGPPKGPGSSRDVDLMHYHTIWGSEPYFEAFWSKLGEEQNMVDQNLEGVRICCNPAWICHWNWINLNVNIRGVDILEIRDHYLWRSCPLTLTKLKCYCMHSMQSYYFVYYKPDIGWITETHTVRLSGFV